jgi:3-methyladenine DNA glycosylase AlkD
VASPSPTAAAFVADLDELRAEHAPKRVPMGAIFALAKEHVGMTTKEIERLLARKDHESRVGAVSVMDFQARAKKTPAAQREELYDLYVRRHDLIDTWDLVDRAAPHVVGGYLADKPRDQLYAFARSEAPMERRSAIVATWFFIRTGDLDDTFAIAEILAHDPDDLVQKAVGGWVREAGKRDQARLCAYLDAFAATMPRTALRYAVEKLPSARRAHYLGLRGAT